MKRLWENIFIRHLVYWLAAYVVIFASVLWHDTSKIAFQVATLIVLPAPLPVYLHFLVLDRYFVARKYFYYIISTLITIGISGLWADYIFDLFFGGPGSHTSGFMMAFFYIVVTTTLKYFSENIKNKYRLQEAEYKQLQTEMNLLKSQINPHFFFNTLNNLYALSLAKSDDVPSVILKLSDLMRYVLETSKKMYVPLKNEIEFLENYIELEKLRLEENCEIKVNISGYIDNYKIAPMLLVPFIENSIKHGVSTSRNGGFINIDFNLYSNHIEFSVVNSKPKTELTESEESSHLGIANVRRRLELLYPGKHELIIEDKNDTFGIKLIITQ